MEEYGLEKKDWFREDKKEASGLEAVSSQRSYNVTQKFLGGL